MIRNTGSSIKRKQPPEDFEMNPDPIRDEQDLADFERMYQEEKAKLDNESQCGN
jgi:hypothetical protein